MSCWPGSRRSCAGAHLPATAGGTPAPLTPKEYDLLAFLALNPGRVFSRDDRTVDVHVRRLREKLEPDPANPALIMTRWGKGYYMEPGRGGGANGG